MASEDDLHSELVSLHRRTGEATGYWPNYFLRAVRKEGGLAVAKKLLAPGAVSSGFDKLVAARRADLSVEAIALDKRFSQLFSVDELEEARHRLREVPDEAYPRRVDVGARTPEEVPPGSYKEGAVLKITVNRYERSQRARAACIRHHGARCAVCGFDFEQRYGDMGRGFIHVHHKRPLGALSATYRCNPRKDLIPVCPNCHAMLHRYDPPLDIEQLRSKLRDRPEGPGG